MDNLLLSKLEAAESAELSRHLTETYLEHGQPVIGPGVPIEYVYFPLNCLLSLVTVLDDGSMVESGTIGREGMSGIPVLLDATQTTMETVTQIPGKALKIPSSKIKEMYDRKTNLHNLLNRYIHTIVVVGSFSAACNARHTIEKRMCRWLLMSSDGVGSDDFDLTHEFLAVMLGVRRSGVSETAMKLQEQGLIAYNRGFIRIKDKERLIQSACECYRRTKDEYRRLL